MPFASAIWIDKLDRLEIDGDGVKVTLASEDQFIRLRMSRTQLMRFVESARMALHESFEDQGGGVVPIGQKKAS